ncbi:MAG TPA: GNAT family N-acetyltransferase [Acidimicrobiales bacterium]|nr:GNAT family N-acetyltransferase [Acidimicrobiales bacterium]
MADADVVGRVHAASWRVAYAQLGEAFLATIVDEERIALWRRVLAEDDGVVFIAPSDAPAGFIYVGASRDDDAPAYVGEVMTFYAAPEAWGTGVGRVLMARAIEELRAMGFAEATLWVLDTNPRARRFYEIAGWRADGGRKHQEWRNASFDEVRYRIAL